LHPLLPSFPTRRSSDLNFRVAKLLTMLHKRPLTKEELELLQKWLACMRMICDTPYILDRDCRLSPKLTELESILEEVLVLKENKDRKSTRLNSSHVAIS